MGDGWKRAKVAPQATRQPVKKITEAKAARLIAAMEAIRECADVTPELIRAFEDVRAEISPWYDR